MVLRSTDTSKSITTANICVPAENYNPAVLMMKSAEDRRRCDLAIPVDRPMGLSLPNILSKDSRAWETAKLPTA